MKRLSLLLLLCVFLAIGCNKNKDYLYRSTFVYNNESAWDITVESHLPESDFDSVFVIPPRGAYTLQFVGEGDFSRPFAWQGNITHSGDYTVFSNQEKQFIHRLNPLNPSTNNLFQYDTYNLVHSEKYDRTYVYTFTDADFADATPIEP